MTIKKHVFLFVISIFSCLLCTCSLPGWNEDLHEFVELGLSPVYLSSSTWRGAGLDAGVDARHGEAVTVYVRLNNPKSFNLTYTLSANSALVMGTPSAPGDTDSAVDQVTSISFTFTPTVAAEHGYILFTLGIKCPSINRTFKPVVVKVRCDSPPGKVENLAVFVTTENKAILGFTLPDDYLNADIAQVEIKYKKGSEPEDSVTWAVSWTGPEGTNVVPALLDSSAGTHVRHVVIDDVDRGEVYNFTLTLIDKSGKRSTTVESVESVAETRFYLGYDKNGGTGIVVAQFGVPGDIILVSASLERSGYLFTGWNTMIGGDGDAYQPGANFTFSSTDTTLYAQWDAGIPSTIVVMNEDDLRNALTGPDAMSNNIKLGDNIT